MQCAMLPDAIYLEARTAYASTVHNRILLGVYVFSYSVLYAVWHTTGSITYQIQYNMHNCTITGSIPVHKSCIGTVLRSIPYAYMNS